MVINGVKIVAAMGCLLAIADEPLAQDVFNVDERVFEELRSKAKAAAAEPIRQAVEISRGTDRAGDEAEVANDAIEVNRRIVGGRVVHISDNAWQVALVKGYLPEPEREQFCGGSIISPDWVVTAAHCVDNFIVSLAPSRVHVIAGTSEYGSGGHRVAVEKIVVHENWARATMDNDIALLKLSAPLTGRNIEPIELVEAGAHPADGQIVQITGWGRLTEGGLGSERLMGVHVPIESTSACNQPQGYGGRLTANMFCAGFRFGGFDSCQGDSGGPVRTTLEGRIKLVGIVSWGEGCARKLKWGIYTRVANFGSWVKEKTR